MKLLIRSLFVTAALAGAASAQTPAPKKGSAETKAPETKDTKETKEKDKPKAPPATPAKQEVSAAEAEKFLVFFNKVVDAMVANKDDCAKLTTSVNGLIDQNVDLVKKMQEAKAANKDLPLDAKQKMLGRIKEMTPALQKCGQDPGFTAAMQRVNNKSAPPAKAADKPAEKTPPATKK
jgi:hypothetical protein